MAKSTTLKLVLTLVVGALVLGLGIVVLSATKDDSAPREQVALYIKARNKELARLALSQPSREIRAWISFSQPQPSSVIVDLVNQQGLEVLEINSIFEDQGGGYRLDRGETIEDSVKNYEAATEQFLDQAIRSREDPEYIAAFGNTPDPLYHQFVRRRSALRSQGVQLYAIEVHGKLSTLASLPAAHPNIVRLVDPEISSVPLVGDYIPQGRLPLEPSER